MAIFACTSCPAEFTHQYKLDNHIAAAHTRLFTMDNYLITDGMPVWDYNLDVVTVDLSNVSPEPNGDVWFATKDANGMRAGLMNGERVRTRHPSTNQSAEAAWTEARRVKMAADRADAAAYEAGFGYGLQPGSESSGDTAIQTLFNNWRRTAGFTQSSDRQIEEAVSITSDMLDECGMAHEDFDATPLANMRAVMQSLVEIVMAQHDIIAALNDTAQGEGF